MKNFRCTLKKANYIQLHRFVRLGDRSDSQVFTFIVPAQLTRGFVNVAQTKEFTYGGQRWQLLLCYQLEDVIASDLAPGSTSYDKPRSNETSRDLNNLQCPPLQKILSNPLNVGITLCGGLAGMHCQLQSCRFTVLNRDSTSANKTHEEKLSTFTADRPVWWKTDWLQVDRLAPEGFLFDDWTWLLEVELRGASTIYEEFLSVSKANTMKTPDGKFQIESATFTYAGSDWSVSLEWLPPEAKEAAIVTNTVRVAAATKTETVGCPRLKLHRHSRTNHWCRVRYRTTLVWGNLGESTFGPIDQLITSNSGASTDGYEIGDPKWFPKSTQPIVWGKLRIKIIVEMLAAAPVSRIDLIPIAPLGGKNLARCKDPEGYDWVVLSDILGTLVRLKFFPVVEVHQHDGTNPPQPTDSLCELRCVAWNVHLIPFQSARGVVKALSSIYICHVPTYRCLGRGGNNSLGSPNDVKEMMLHPEEAVEVALDLSVENVCDKDAGYVHPRDNTMTIRVEWLQSQNLCHSHYNVYDDLLQTQRKELCRELRALQMENCALKRQLLASGTSQTIPSTRQYSLTNSLTPVVSAPKPSNLSNSPDIFPKTSNFVRSASDSQHSSRRPSRKSPVMATPPPPTAVSKQSSLQLPKNDSNEEEGDWQQDHSPHGTRRHSSFNALLDGRGKARRSLPTFTRVNWRLQRRYCQEQEEDDECSDGHSSCGENSIYLAVKSACVHSNLSSPARRPVAMKCWSSSANSVPSPQHDPSPTHPSLSPTTPVKSRCPSFSRSPENELNSKPT